MQQGGETVCPLQWVFQFSAEWTVGWQKAALPVEMMALRGHQVLNLFGHTKTCSEYQKYFQRKQTHKEAHT